MILALAAAVLLLAQQEPTGTLRGEVRSELSGQPLAGAVVEVRTGGAIRSTLSGSRGDYRIGEVPAGRRLLRVSHLGYEPLELELMVAPGAELVVDLSLRLRPVEISGVVVTGSRIRELGDTVRAPPASFGLAGMRVLETTTPGLAELGFGDSYRGSPGQGPIDPSDVLYVRGAPADLKLVLLDGAPVYTPFHVAGLLDSFEADVLRSATLHLGGAPARYDGGLSYIMELETRSGREEGFRSSGALDLMSARATMDGSLGGRFRMLAGGRLVHGFGMTEGVDGRFPYAYGEGLLRVDGRLGRHGGVSFTAFRNDEGVAMDSLRAWRQDAGWGNTAYSLRYRGRLGQNHVEIGTAYGGFEATLPVRAGSAHPTWGRTERVRLTADVSGGDEDLVVRYGASFDHLRLDHRIPGDQPGTGWASETGGSTGGLYAEAAWQVAPRLRLRGGARGDLFLVEPSIRVAPRLAATWLLSDRAALTAAAGRYHQYVRQITPMQVVRQDAAPDTLFLASGLAVGEANHFNLSLHQELDDQLRLGVEGFFKSFEGGGALVEPSHSSGVDLWVRKEEGRYRGWLGYSLSWVWSAGGRQMATESFAGRQLLNAGISGPLGRLLDLEGRVAYGSGLPFTAIPLDISNPSATPQPASYEQLRYVRAGSAADTPLLPGAPSDTYLRVDLVLSRNFRAELNGRRMAIAPYVKVLNSLNRRDSLFYWYDPRDEHGPRPIAALPVVPIVGFSWSF